MLALIILTLWSSAPTQSPPYLFEGVTIHGDQIVFSLSGRLWQLSVTGGEAKPLTPGDGRDTHPHFSPDGTKVAWVKHESGGDVYAMNLDNPREQRLTWFPGMDFPTGWNADGKAVIFVSRRAHPNVSALFQTGLESRETDRLPVANGIAWTLAPNGQEAAFIPHGLHQPTTSWDTYRGGMSAPIHRYNLSSQRITPWIPAEYNAHHPIWTTSGLYFISDRHGAANIYRADGDRVQAMTQYKDFGVTQMAHDKGRLVFVRRGRLHLTDLTDFTPEKILCTAPLNEARRRVRLLKTNPQLTDLRLAKNSNDMLLTARGEVFHINLAGGKTQNLTKTSDSREYDARISPDGANSAWFADHLGKLSLHVGPLSGTRKIIELENQTVDYKRLQWSGDGRYLSFCDTIPQLWIIRVSDGKTTRINGSQDPGQQHFDTDWSHDGRYLAYTLREENRQRRVWIHDTETGSNHQISTDYFHAGSPRFDASGRYLYYLASPNNVTAEVWWSVLSARMSAPFMESELRVVALAADTPLPFAPHDLVPNRVDWSPLDRVIIDFEQIQARTISAFAGQLQLEDLHTGTPGNLYLVNQLQQQEGGLEARPDRELLHVNLRLPGKREKLAHAPEDLAVSASEDRLLVHSGNEWRQLRHENGAWIKRRYQPPPMLAKISMEDEWRQIFWETIRLMRAYFYDPDTHGFPLRPRSLDAGEVKLDDKAKGLVEELAAYLPGVNRREQLKLLQKKLVGMLSTSHFRLGGGDESESFSMNEAVGFLGVDWTHKDGRYQFSQIHAPDMMEAGLYRINPPLGYGGHWVAAGELLLTINDREVTTQKDIYRWFAGTAGKRTRLKVGRNPDGSDAREIEVVPLKSERSLRLAAWASQNRRRVTQLSQGKITYIHIPEFDMAGIRAFLAGYHQAYNNGALLIDQRFNGGGTTADTIIDLLRREAVYHYKFRQGNTLPTPLFAKTGPRALLINQWNGSAAETFALMFKLAGLGEVIGSPTFGAGIGGYGLQPTLVDGAALTIPNRASFDPAGSWGIENTGVQPSIRVASKPGEDHMSGITALDRAVGQLMQELTNYQPSKVVVPAFPNYAETRQSK